MHTGKTVRLHAWVYEKESLVIAPQRSNLHRRVAISLEKNVYWKLTEIGTIESLQCRDMPSHPSVFPK